MKVTVRSHRSISPKRLRSRIVDNRISKVLKRNRTALHLPNMARGTFHSLRTLSPLSVSSSIAVSLLARTNFSLSAAPPDEIPNTSAPAFLKSGPFCSKAQTCRLLTQQSMICEANDYSACVCRYLCRTTRCIIGRIKEHHDWLLSSVRREFERLPVVRFQFKIWCHISDGYHGKGPAQHTRTGKAEATDQHHGECEKGENGEYDEHFLMPTAETSRSHLDD